MTSSLRRFGALVGAAALVLGLAACSDASSSSSPAPAEIDYSACSTDDSADQNANVDRSGKRNFPSISGDDTPVIAAGKGSEPTDKVLVKTLKQGDGALVCPGATIKANYVGALWNGTVFDSSYKKGEPVEFSLEQVVKGWTHGLAHTHVGDRVELVIPASLGYGGQARGNIPANSTLTIDESVAAPTEQKIYTIYKGSGEELADGESFLYKLVRGGFGAQGQTQSSWNQGASKAAVSEAAVAGYTVGSRLLIVTPIPAQDGQSGASAQASVMVVDIVGTSSMQ